MYTKPFASISILLVISLFLVSCTGNQPSQGSEQQTSTEDTALPATGDAALDESLTVVNQVKDDAEEDDTDTLLQDLEEVDALLDEI